MHIHSHWCSPTQQLKANTGHPSPNMVNKATGALQNQQPETIINNWELAESRQQVQGQPNSVSQQAQH